MNYDLAKKLKDAGFPQIVINGASFYIEQEMGQNICAPTLSQLIEACGGKLHRLDHINPAGTTNVSEWGAICADIKVWASTPEEAVANLWLKLNNKT